MSELEDARRLEEALARTEGERAMGELMQRQGQAAYELQLQELRNETGPDCE